MSKKVTLDQIMEVATSLFDERPDVGTSEYIRGVCELIGRIRLDVLQEGESTHENALESAGEIARLALRTRCIRCGSGEPHEIGGHFCHRILARRRWQTANIP